MHSQSERTVLRRTVKISLCFSRTSPRFCIWRRKLPVSLLIRCCDWKTFLFTAVFLELHFNSCREAVKWNDRRMLGTTGEKKIPQFWAPVFAVRWPSAIRTSHRCGTHDHRWRHDGEECVDASACRQHPPPAFTPPQTLPFWLVSPSKTSAGYPLCLHNPSTGGLPGQHSQGVGAWVSSLQVVTW